jgi:hypothetical protein
MTLDQIEEEKISSLLMINKKILSTFPSNEESDDEE